MKNLTICLLILLLTGCAVFTTAGDKVKKVNLGMSKQQVTSIMGTDYKVVEMRKEGDRNLEVISYLNYQKDNLAYYYYLFFIDNTLDELREEVIRIPTPRHPRNE